MNEKKFIKDILQNKKTNEEIRKEYGFKSYRDMFSFFDKLKKKYNIKIKSKCSKKELKEIKNLTKRCLNLLK